MGESSSEMTVENNKKYQNLSRLLDTSFGKSSTVSSPSQSIKFKLIDDKMLKATFLMIVNFGSENVMREMMIGYKKQAESMILAALKKSEEDYKDSFKEKISLKLNSGTIQDYIEYVSVQNPKKTAFYRMECLVKIK